MRSIFLRSSSFGMSRSAIALVWSGVSACFVSATRRPSMRARKTSPALMWRSDAPRSTAALMIFSMNGLSASVARVLVHEVPEGIPASVAHPVVQEQFELAFPEPSWRHGSHVRRDEHLPEPPQWAIRWKRLFPEDVEHRAAQSPAAKAFDERRLVQERTARHVNDDCSGREAIHSRPGQQPPRLAREGSGEDEDVRVRQLRIEPVEPDDAFEAARGAALRPAADADTPSAEGVQAPPDPAPNAARTHDERPAFVELPD